MVFDRLLTAEEMPGALRLWVQVFGEDERFFTSLLDGGDPEDFSVGTFDGERQVSSVHVFMRRFRDREGRPLKVGSIGSVSTLKDERSKGHSGRLLQLAIQEMQMRGCVWSYLGTGVNDHYARQGWRTVSTPSFHGELSPHISGASVEPSVVDERLLAQMADAYDSITKTLPMAAERSQAMWLNAVRYRVTRPGDAVFASYRGEGLAAYVVAQRSGESLDLVEAACAGGQEEALRDLVRKTLAHASAQGQKLAGCRLPEASVGFAAFAESCSHFWPREDRAWMARPIAGRIGMAELAAILADPRGRRSDLDNF